MAVAVAAALACLGTVAAEVARDETVVFYPTFAVHDADHDRWSLRLSGVVFEPEEDSMRRGLVVDGVRRSLGVEGGTPEAAILGRRLRRFLVDNEGGKTIAVRLGGRVYPVGTSSSNGGFSGLVDVPTSEVAGLLGVPRPEGRWLKFHAVLPPDDPRQLTGRVQLVGTRGLSIISDIDDTIKHTQVTDRRAMLRNTFLREFRPVPDMAELYAAAAERGAVVHYVSSSPCQLYGPLAGLLQREGFPAGSFHLKQFSLADPSNLEALFGSHEGHKRPLIESILTLFPQRRFVLVGDSGEEDPEIYVRLAREHPRQVVAVMIRNVTGASLDDDRFRKAARGVRQFLLFRKPDEVRALWDELIEEHGKPR